MKSLKQSCKNNWYVMAATLLMVVCSEVLTGIMKYNSFPDSFDLLEFSGNSVLKVAVLVGGVVLSFVITLISDNKLSGIFAALFTVYTLLFSCFVFDSEGWFYFSLFTVMIMLVFYYKNACLDSAGHTVFYYILLTVSAITVAIPEEIEIFVILLTAVIMFAVNRNKISSKPALVINYVFSVLAIIAVICLLVEGMDSYFGIKFVEGDGYHLESLYLDTRPFGKAEYYYHRDLEMTSLYNLAKIFRHFGYVAGTAMCVVIALFALSFFVKCFGSNTKPGPAGVLAAMMISVRCIAGFFENFSIICGMRVRIPILSDDIAGYLLVGIMLGFMLASEEITNSMVITIERIAQKISKKQEVSEPEPEPDKPHLTLVGSKEDDDV